MLESLLPEADVLAMFWQRVFYGWPCLLVVLRTSCGNFGCCCYVAGVQGSRGGRHLRSSLRQRADGAREFTGRVRAP